MHSTMFMDKYPVHTFTLSKNTVPLAAASDVIAALKEKVDTDAVADFIAIYDHFAHTQALPQGEVAEGIQAVQLLVFCFGIKLPGPEAVAVRPRSIGVTEYADHFVISFMAAPNPAMNATMQQWVKELATL